MRDDSRRRRWFTLVGRLSLGCLGHAQRAWRTRTPAALGPGHVLAAVGTVVDVMLRPVAARQVRSQRVLVGEGGGADVALEVPDAQVDAAVVDLDGGFLRRAQLTSRPRTCEGTDAGVCHGVALGSVPRAQHGRTSRLRTQLGCEGFAEVGVPVPVPVPVLGSAAAPSLSDHDEGERRGGEEMETEKSDVSERLQRKQPQAGPGVSVSRLVARTRGRRRTHGGRCLLRSCSLHRLSGRESVSSWRRFCCC